MACISLSLWAANLCFAFLLLSVFAFWRFFHLFPCLMPLEHFTLMLFPSASSLAGSLYVRPSCGANVCASPCAGWDCVQLSVLVFGVVQ